MRKNLGSTVSIHECLNQDLPDVPTAIKFYEEQIKDLVLPFGTNTVFEITVFQGSRQVKEYILDKPLEPEGVNETVLVFA